MRARPRTPPTALPRTTVARTVFLAVLATLFTATPARAQTSVAPMRRIAVLVGANGAPPGRSPLRFAHDDAQQLADALVRVGRFATSDVHVLFDPAPAELDAALAAATNDVRAAGGDALFVFYYSGHSDGQSLYPHGEAVSVGSIRDRIEHIGAQIRVGILDTCRGGSWTQAKGLTVVVGAPWAFAVPTGPPLVLREPQFPKFRPGVQRPRRTALPAAFWRLDARIYVAIPVPGSPRN